MDAFLRLSPEERRLACQQVDEQMRLQAVSVEKDFWVCWTLRELFALPDIGQHLTFKGGTSLSKAWGLIRRFSEDIDLVVDKEALGFGGDAAPEKAPSKKKRRDRLEALMEASRKWVQEKLQPALAGRLHAALGESGWKLEVDPDMADGQCLLFHYPSAFPPGTAGYVRPVVKIELGARSDDWPHEQKTIQPYVAELFPSPCAQCRILRARHRGGTHLLGKSLPAARGNFPSGGQAPETPHGPPLLRSLVSAVCWSWCTSIGQPIFVPTRRGASRNFLPPHLGGLHHPPSGHIPAAAAGTAPRQLAGRLRANARTDVFR